MDHGKREAEGPENSARGAEFSWQEVGAGFRAAVGSKSPLPVVAGITGGIWPKWCGKSSGTNKSPSCAYLQIFPCRKAKGANRGAGGQGALPGDLD